MGATWGMIYSHYIDDNGDSQIIALTMATMATMGVAAKQHPVIQTGDNLYNALMTPRGNTKFIKDLKRRIGVNKAQDVFKLMDYDTGEDE